MARWVIDGCGVMGGRGSSWLDGLTDGCGVMGGGGSS